MWKLLALGGFGLSIFMDLNSVQIIVVPLLLLWFINVFSGMGYKERHHDMLQLISAMPKGRLRQVMYSYTAGLFVMFVLLLPVTIRMFAAGQFPGVAVAVSALIFIPSLSLFLGEVAKTNRFFEMLMIFATYLIMNDIHFVNYVGLHPDIISVTRGVTFLVIGVVLGVSAIIKRVRTL